MNVPLRLDASSCRRTLARRTRTVFAWLAMSLLMCLLTPPLGAAEDKATPFITGVLDLSLSNYYLTYRGVITENAGVIFQPSLLLTANLYESNGPLSNISFTTGIWNSIHSKRRLAPGSTTTTPNWNEFDFIAALNVTAFKAWTLTIDYEYWTYPSDTLPNNSIIQFKLAYADSFMKGLLPNIPGELSINPYINFFVELHNKSVAATDESFYFELGFTPKYVFAKYPLSIELPTYFIFPAEKFYGESSVLGLFGTGVKVTAPLTFIPERYGRWSVHTDLVYKHLVNDAIVAGNAALSTTRNPVQAIAGLTLNF